MAVKKESFSGYLRFRIDDAIKDEFARACIASGETSSHVLRDFIRDYLNDHKNGKAGKKVVAKPADPEKPDTEKPRYVAPIQDY